MSGMSARLTGAAAGVVAVVVIASLVLVAPAVAQTPPGNAALPRPAATPRTPDGRVDLNGVYQSSPKRGEWDASAPGQGGGPQNEPPSLLPAARQRAQELLNRRSIDDPTAYCLPSAGPRMTGVILFPIQFVQTPGQVVIIYEYFNAVRIIPTDGRPHPADAEPTYQGDSVGRWDGDTLVVDVNNFKEGNWLAAGIVSSDKLHITERYTRIDKDQLNYEAVIEDPNLLAKPWTIRRTLMLRDGVRVREYVCAENNLDPARYQDTEAAVAVHAVARSGSAALTHRTVSNTGGSAVHRNATRSARIPGFRRC